MEPTLDRTFFRSGRGAAADSDVGERFFGDLGVERITATFLISFPALGGLPPAALLAGDLGVPGLLCPLVSGVLGESGKKYRVM